MLLIIMVLAVAGFLYLLSSTDEISSSDIRVEDLNLRTVEQVIADDKDRIYALVFLNGTKTLSIEQTHQFISKKWPAHNALSPIKALGSQKQFSSKKTSFSFELAKSYFDRQKLAQACKHDYYWPNVGSEIQAHQLVIVVGVRTHGKSLSHCIALSQAVGAIISTTSQASGALWTLSDLMISRKFIKQHFTGQFEKTLPINLWIACHTYKDEQGRTVGYTQGLTWFNQVDFEAIDAPESPKALRSRLTGLINYSVLNCAKILNGDSVGEDKIENIKLQKRPSEIGNKGWVFQLSYIRPSQKNPWRHQ